MSHGHQQTASPVSRRTYLKLVGASGATGLAGCVQSRGTETQPGNGAGTGTGGGTTVDIGTVTYGMLNPMTGPYGGLAQGQRNGNKLAVKHVNENDEFDFEIEAVYEDTEADPATGQQKAQRLVEQEGAQYLMGAISSSVALGLNTFAKEAQVIYNPGGAAIPITGERCNPYVFRFETNTAQIAEAAAPWTIQNLGTKVWFHIADYAYGESVLNEWRSRMDEAGDLTVVGVSRSALGAGNFESYISDIANSEAEVAVLGMTGGDLITFFSQAHNQGLKEQVRLMAATGSFQVIRGAAPEASANTWNGVRYVPTLETGDNQSFVSAYEEEFGSKPDNFARVGYESVRMTCRGIQNAGTADPTVVKDTLSGMEMPTIFGQNRFRECDHQAMNPVWIGKNVMNSGDVPSVELIQKVEGENAIPACSEVNCSL